MWLRLVKTLDSTSPSKSHFGWETTHCGPMALKFDFFRVLLVRSTAVGTFTFHAPDLCGPRWPADGSHRHPSGHQSCGQQNCKTMAKIPKIIILGYSKGDSCQISPLKNVNKLLRAASSIFWEDPRSVYSAMSSNMFGAWWAFTTASNLLLTKNPPSMNKWLPTPRHPAQVPRCSHQELCIDGVPWGRVLRDFRSRSCFCLNSYRSCDTCLIVKTLPFAECTISDYTFLSQASNEQGKAHASIAIVPLFLCRYSKRQKMVTWKAAGWAWASTIETRQRSIKMKGTSTVELQMELQRYASRKKRVARDSSLRWLPKIFKKISQRNIYETLEFGLRSVSGERDHWKEPSKYLETWELTWNGKTTCSMQSHAERKFSQKQTTWKERIYILAAVWIYLPQLRGSWFSFDQSRHNGNTRTDFHSTFQNKIPNGSHCFHWAHKISMTQLGAPWQVILWVSSEKHLSHPTEQYPEQSSNTGSWIDRGRASCFSWGAALAWFTHPTAMASNFRSETIHVATRLLVAWSAVGYGERGWFGGTLLCVNYSSASGCFVWGGRNLFFLKIEEHQENQATVSNEHPFSIAPRKQNLVDCNY